MAIETSATRYKKSDDGLSIIGIVIAVTILLLTLIPATKLLEATIGVSGNNRDRVAAAGLANSSLETIRLLANSNFTGFINANLGTKITTQKVGPTTFTIQTELAWSTGTLSAQGCAVQGTSKTFNQPIVEATVSISWVATPPTPPEVANEIIIPPPQAYGGTTQAGSSTTTSPYSPSSGNLSIDIYNAANGPSAGVWVQVSNSTQTQTVATDANGCAFFPFLTAGAYTVSLPSSLNPGYVDNSNNPNPSVSATVTLGNTTSVQFAYDKGAYLSLGDPNSEQLAITSGLTAANSQLALGGSSNVTQSSNPSNNLLWGPLFPFSSGYQIWLGSCYTLNAVPPYPALSSTPITSVTPGGTTAISPAYATATVTATINGSPATGDTIQAIPVANTSGTPCATSTPMSLGQIGASPSTASSVTSYLPLGYFELQAVDSNNTVVIPPSSPVSILGGGPIAFTIGN